MTITNISTLTFHAEGNYFIDIVSHSYPNDHMETYIYNINYGVKELLFGVYQTSLDDVIEMVENELAESINIYKETYENEE